MKRLTPICLTILILMSGSALAIDFSGTTHDSAFSPNGDSSQDSCSIEIDIAGEGEDLVSVYAGIYSVSDQEPDVAFLIRTLLDLELATPNGSYHSSLTWDGKDGSDALQPEGVYYLQMHAATADTDLWRQTATTIFINNAGPTIESQAIEPGFNFNPTNTDPPNQMQIFFDSYDFDVATDFARAEIEKLDSTSGSYSAFEMIERDVAYLSSAGGVPRYRFVWDGGLLSQGAIVDGLYRATITIGDYAGNPDDVAAPLGISMDTTPPVLKVAELGPADVLSPPTIYIHPDDIPDSIIVTPIDQSSVAACSLGFVADTLFSVAGTPCAWGDGEEPAFSFPLPAAEWVAYGDSVYQLFFNGEDVSGNSNRQNRSVLRAVISVDGTPPPDPAWLTTSSERVQPWLLLEGTCEEADATVIITSEGEELGTAPVNVYSEWVFMTSLDEGSQTLTAQAIDKAGNLSPGAPSITLTYSAGPVMRIPGRFYGGRDEDIYINTSETMRELIIRVYTLDGVLVRILDFNPQSLSVPEYRINWDLTDEEGNRLMDGLYIMNIAMTDNSGTRTFERKVVAIVRD
ncbi:MAG: hypothetical protein GY835_17755 [bacterium]|nr:hypothetical protein [bacterium]